MKTLRLLAVSLLLSFTSFASAKVADSAILFIADGMGPSLVTGARIWKGGVDSKLNMEKFPVVGIAKVYSADSYITDSAAAATTLATGIKTYNGSIGKSYAKTDPTKKSQDLKTIFDVAIQAGKSVGIVTTTRVTHATPASFYAHAKSRDEEIKIGEYIKDSRLDFILGGGKKRFSNSEKDKLKKAGWKIITKRSELNKSTSKKVLGLFNRDHLSFSISRKKKSTEPTLKEMTKWGIKRLSKNKKGYLLIVEGGRIDHAAHVSQAKKAFGDVVAFDNAIGSSLKLVGPGTLVVVTADHNTGGVSLNGYGQRHDVKKDVLLGKAFARGKVEKKRTFISWATGPRQKESNIEMHDDNFHHKSAYEMKIATHTATDVYVLSKGNGQNLFGGFMENSEIPKRILKAMGLSF